MLQQPLSLKCVSSLDQYKLLKHKGGKLQRSLKDVSVDARGICERSLRLFSIRVARLVGGLQVGKKKGGVL